MTFSIGDKVRVRSGTGFALFREGLVGTVVRVENRRNNDPLVAVEWADLVGPASTYSMRHLEWMSAGSFAKGGAK